MTKSTRDEMLTLLGAARAVCEVYSAQADISERARHGYRLAYGRWVAGAGELPAGMAASTRRWSVSAVRFGTLERLRASAAALEGAVNEPAGAAARLAADEVRDCLATLERFPAGRLGKRAGAGRAADVTAASVGAAP